MPFFDFTRVLHFGNQKLCRAQTAANQNMYFGSDPRHFNRRLHGAVSAADNRDSFIAIKRTVTGCAIAYAARGQGFFARNTERAAALSRGDNGGLASIGFAIGRNGAVITVFIAR